MRKGILGRKVGMTQIFQPDGSIVPVTVIEAGPCKVLQVKTVDRDGYDAVQLGFKDKPRRLASRSERGHVADISSKRSAKLKAAGVAVVAKSEGEPKKFIKELRGDAGLPVGLQRVLTQVVFARVARWPVTMVSIRSR
ncbi:MAG: hypothetical protein LW720_17350 [Pirellula sp.]|nr:hypothetical protein [Pirellula sp.]